MLGPTKTMSSRRVNVPAKRSTWVAESAAGSFNGDRTHTLVTCYMLLSALGVRLLAAPLASALHFALSMYVYGCGYVYVYVYMYVCMYVYKYIRVYIYIFIYVVQVHLTLSFKAPKRPKGQQGNPQPRFWQSEKRL